MRVALVCGYDWAVPGGVQTQVRAIARALSGRVDEVAVVTPLGRASGGPERFSEEGYRLFGTGRAFGLPANGSVAPVAPTPQAVASTWRALRSIAPDVVHVHEPLVPGPPLAAVLAGRRPIVGTFHRADADALYRAEGRVLGALVGHRIVVATAVSRAAADTARAVLGPRIGEVREIENGVEVSRFAAAATALDPRAGAGASGGASRTFKNGARPRIVFFGRHEPRKGASLFVEAVRSLELDVDAVVAGEGPETPSVRRAAGGERRLRLVGPPGDDELAALVASADVVVAPALGGESFGMVLLEAMAAGAAVVASDIPGYRLAAAGAARLFRAGDASSLAAALVEVLSEPSARLELVERGRRRAQELSIDHVVVRYLECYEAARSLAPEAGRPG